MGVHPILIKPYYIVSANPSYQAYQIITTHGFHVVAAHRLLVTGHAVPQTKDVSTVDSEVTHGVCNGCEQHRGVNIIE